MYVYLDREIMSRISFILVMYPTCVFIASLLLSKIP